MMNFEKFVNYIKENVTMGWKEDASTKIFVVQKNNGVKLHALCINEPDTNISPSIYLEEYYNSYQDGLSMESVVENIRKKYVEKKLLMAIYQFLLMIFLLFRIRFFIVL